MPDGIAAANQLGLTNAVPAKASYVTDGATRNVKIGNQTVRLRHAGPSVMAWAGKSSAPVVQALRWLGPQASSDTRVAATLKSKLPDADRISRHYYDAAVITATEVGASALADEALLTAVREHNLIAFRQAWKKFDEAVPGSVRVVPQDALRAAIEKDYEAMQGMMLGDAPEFDWVMKQLQAAEDTINRR